MMFFCISGIMKGLGFSVENSGINVYQNVIDDFVRQNRTVLGGNLVGVYLHGSAVMGCFHSQRSDLDFLVVIKEKMPDAVKREYMDLLVQLNRQAPPKGMELSIVREGVCNPFVYPTPYELHFSRAHLDWYLSNPEDYIQKMKGTDKDLAAHATIVYHRGKTLYGKGIREVFSEVSRADYFDSIWEDIKNADEQIMDAPMYFILNLCRVLAYKREGCIFSKQEGGEWGLANVPQTYAGLISGAVTEYRSDDTAEYNEPLAKEYARYMLEQIACE